MSDLGIRVDSQKVTEEYRLARLVFFVFLLTFILSRMLVFLIMARAVPDLFLHLGGTHVHHLNYGIFLLAGVGGYLLFRPSAGRRAAAIVYAIGLALTFDEFGMWLHLGGSYWQRASWDAVVVTATILGLFAFGPAIARYRPRHWLAAAVVIVSAAVFFFCLAASFRYASRFGIPKLERLEDLGPR